MSMRGLVWLLLLCLATAAVLSTCSVKAAEPLPACAPRHVVELADRSAHLARRLDYELYSGRIIVTDVFCHGFEG